jgi:hypothetical protein
VTERGGRLTGPVMRTRREAPSPAPARPHHPHRRRGGRLPGDQESILDLQRLFGNAAVASALSRVRGGGNRVASVHRLQLDRKAMAPQGGLKSIRDKVKGRGVLGLTIRGIEDAPPFFRADTPAKGKDGWTTKAQSVRKPPEPILEEYWPTQGLHKIAERTFIDVTQDWEGKLEKGEDEHADDARLAVELTWKKVAEAINALAKQPGKPEASAEAATAALWKRYVASLPKDLRPADASIDAQKDVLAVRKGTFFGWMWESTVVRDTRGYHEPRPKPKNVAGKDIINEITPADSKIPGPSSTDLLENDLRKKYVPGKTIIGSNLPDR